MQNITKILIGFGILLTAFLIWYYTRHPLTAWVQIHGTTFSVEVAATAPEKAKGLGYRSSLEPKHGMIFPYDHKEVFPFWMLGMKFPLDFIWIDGTKVVDITTNVQPPTGTDMHVVHPKVAVDKILEVNAGEVEKYGIRVGDTVVFNK